MGNPVSPDIASSPVHRLYWCEYAAGTTLSCTRPGNDGRQPEALHGDQRHRKTETFSWSGAPTGAGTSCTQRIARGSGRAQCMGLSRQFLPPIAGRRRAMQSQRTSDTLPELRLRQLITTATAVAKKRNRSSMSKRGDMSGDRKP